jgi:hypothetical protein
VYEKTMTTPRDHRFINSRLGWRFLIVALILAGLGIRIIKAWQIHFVPDSDYSLVALMVKHIAQGTDFPIFFYGQMYMGTLEPALTALLSKVIGISLFTTFLGTTLIGGLTLLLIYLWAREAGGRHAGLVALLISLAGSNAYLHYSVAPCGGYMTMLNCGLLVIYLSCRIVTRLKAGVKVSPGAYVGLGLAGGIGWWSGQLMVVFLITACVILLLGVSKTLIRNGLLLALPFFFIGSAPWWIWNATHSWGTFAFAGNLGARSASEGIVAFGISLLNALDYAAEGNIGRLLFLGLGLVLATAFFVLLIRDALSQKGGGAFPFKLAAPLVVLALLSVSVTSKYVFIENNQRYFLPVLPSIAVMWGCVAGWLIQKKWLVSGWILTALLAAVHLAPVAEMSRTPTAERQESDRIAATLSPLCDGTLLGVYSFWHWLNFLSDEKLCVADPVWERYAPYGRHWELSSHPAILNNYENLHEFLAYSGSQGQELDFDAPRLTETQWRSLRFSAIMFQAPEASSIHVDYALTPPSDDWDYMDPAVISQVRDHLRVLPQNCLTDMDLNTGWETRLKAGESASLTFEFNEPQSLCGLRMVSAMERTPGSLAIEGMAPGDTQWQSLLPKFNFTSYFWSGSFLKWEGVQCLPEVRFTSPTGGVLRLRITVQFPDSDPRFVCVDEVLFLKQASHVTRQLPSVDDCLAILDQENVRTFYGPRWMTERLACRKTRLTNLDAPSSLSRSVQNLPVRDPSKPAKLTFEETTGLLVESRDVPRTRSVLKQTGQHWTERPLGSMILMVVSKATDNIDGVLGSPVSWTERGCFKGETWLNRKVRAEMLFQKTLTQKQQLTPSALIEMLEKALSFYPQHQPARHALVAAMQKSGTPANRATQQLILAEKTHPALDGYAVFHGGVTLVGVSLSTNVATPGQTLEVTYFWKCPRTANPKQYSTFVNFQKGKERFQDDHSLLDGVPAELLSYQPFEEVFSYARSLTIPKTVSPGDYKIVIGLIDMKHHQKRLKPVSSLPVIKQGVHLSGLIKIVRGAKL